jgi:hypothetical protein
MVEKVIDNEIAVVSEKKIAYRQASAEFRSQPSILKSIRAKVEAFLADKKPHQRVDVGVADEAVPSGVLFAWFAKRQAQLAGLLTSWSLSYYGSARVRNRTNLNQ